MKTRGGVYIKILKSVAYFKPKIFIIENVPGIRSAAGGHFFNRVQHEARQLGYRVHSELIKAWEFGVPQKRIRQLIIGTKLKFPFILVQRSICNQLILKILIMDSKEL